MARRLNVPNEIDHLIEKREQDDRREQQRFEATTDDTLVSDAEADSTSETDANERRQLPNRRNEQRQGGEQQG